MRTATPTTEMMPVEEYLEMDSRWDTQYGEPPSPFEPGARNWGWFKGRRVAIDYAINVMIEHDEETVPTP
ncbi:hypothetical protein ABIC01_000883 [Bradyrhizobium sp. RT4b]